MAFLSYLSDEQFLPIIQTMIDKIKKKQDALDESLSSNTLDPFNALFQSAVLGLRLEYWTQLERARQLQKTFEHQMGFLHQSVLGALPNWTNLETGNVTDLVNENAKICAEVKNKFNTVKASDEAGIYDKLLGLIGTSGVYRGFTAYYVSVVPKRPKPSDDTFTPSDNASGVRKPANVKIRRIDGYSFYALATGKPHALRELFEAIEPAVAQVAKTKRTKQDFESLFVAAYGKQ
jgi:Eco47II restriction endonuclease